LELEEEEKTEMRVETPPDSAPGIPGADVGPAASDGDADSVIGVSGPKSVEDRAATDVETGHTDRHSAAFHMHHELLVQISSLYTGQT